MIEEFITPPPNGLIVITGATGWVGRTAIYELQRLLTPKDFVERVRLFASKAAVISFPAYEFQGPFDLLVQPLEGLPALAKSHEISTVFHTAFLTRDRLSDVGREQYVKTNRWITSQLVEALEFARSARAVIISTGAAEAFDEPSSFDEEGTNDIYGLLKHEEEVRLSGLVPSLVLRIYALSGRFIRKAERFALGDFLVSALRKERICINSTTTVLRSYGNAGDITALAWKWLFEFSGDLKFKKPIAAVTMKTDLLNLAQEVTKIFGLPPVKFSIDFEAIPNSYIADSSLFLQLLDDYGLIPKTLEQQLLETAAGLSNSAEQIILK